MAEQMAVQNQGNYAVPGLLGGAAVGGLGGYYLDKTGWSGVTKNKYTSFQDILKEKKDAFEPAKDATDDVKTALDNIKNKKTEFVTKMKGLAENRVWDPKIATEGAALDKAKQTYKEAFDKLVTQAEGGTLVNGQTAAKDKTEALKQVNKYIKDNISKADSELSAELQELKKAKDGIKTAREALKKKASAENVQAHKIIKDLDLNKLKTEFYNSIKDDIGKFKTPNKWVNAAIGAGILALAGLGIGTMMKKDEA